MCVKEDRVGCRYKRNRFSTSMCMSFYNFHFSPNLHTAPNYSYTRVLSAILCWKTLQTKGHTEKYCKWNDSSFIPIKERDKEKRNFLRTFCDKIKSEKLWVL